MSAAEKIHAPEGSPSMRIATFLELSDTKPVHLEIDWPGLVAMIRRHEFRKVKDGPLISPAEFRAGATRSKDAAERLHFGVVDLDRITDDELREVRAALEGVRHVIHTTWSHPEARSERLGCYRVIVAFSRPVAAPEWPSFWPAMIARLRAPADRSCRDASRIYFIPSAPIGSEADAWSEPFDGDPLDVDAILAAHARKSERRSNEGTRRRSETTANDVEKRAIAYIAKMEPAISGSRGHAATWAVALVLARGFDLDEETTFRLLRDHYNPRCQPEWDDRALIHKARQAAKADAPRGFLLNDDRPWRPERYQFPAEPRPALRDADAEEWQAPEPIGRDVTPPVFPVHVFPAWVGDLVESVARSLQVPIDLPATFGLGALAAVTGKRTRVRAWDGFEEATNIYTVVATPPSTLKSPVHRYVTEPIARFEEEMQERMAPEIARAISRRAVAEKRLRRVQELAAKAPEGDPIMAEVDELAEAFEELEIPAKPCVIVDDTTPEQLKTILAEQKGEVAMLSADSSFFGNIASQRYSKAPNIEAALSAHSGDDIRVDRRGRREIIKDPRLSICIAIQPSVLTEAFKNDTARERGLFARFLYSIPTSNIGFRDLSEIPPTVSTVVKDAWDANLRTIAHGLRQKAEPIVFPLSEPARTAFQQWRAHIETKRRPGGEYASIEAWAGKLDGHLLRLAGLLHVAEAAGGTPGREIRPETISSAIALADYFTAHAMIAFDVMGDDERFANVRKILTWIRSKGDPSFTRSSAQVAFKGRMKREELSDALSILVDHGHLRRAKQKGTGRPAEVYEVNPAVLAA